MNIKHSVILSGPLKYTKGVKYQTDEDISCFVPALVNFGEIHYKFLHLVNGELKVDAGWAWDGASGPTFDTESSMRGGLFHDALYMLIRQGLLPESTKELADELLHDICVMDEMWHWRANAWYKAVDKLADSAADPKNRKKVYTAGC